MSTAAINRYAMVAPLVAASCLCSVACSEHTYDFSHHDTATQSEIARRQSMDFSLDDRAMLAKLQDQMPDATLAHLHRWRDRGFLQHKMIDGQTRYFKREPVNLMRFCAEARELVQSNRNQEAANSEHSHFSLHEHIRQLVAESEQSDTVQIHPMHHRVRYALVVPAGHPKVVPGAKVRCWLPFPQEVDQQENIRLISSNVPVTEVAPNLHPQRSAYFEHTATTNGEPLRFEITVEFVTSAICPKLDPAMAKSHDPHDKKLAEYLRPRPPHIPLDSKVRRLASTIVEGESNPLERARRVFRWVCENIDYCAEMEYSTIPSLTVKALNSGKGDCGVQAMTFISLCRAAGIPARWQSGWESLPGQRNMHDWAQFYVEPWGWLPADPSYGLYKDDDERVAEFYFGHMDPYRMIVNLDYGREFSPPKKSFRSEPNDFQRGEIEIDGENLYFDEWKWECDMETKPVDSSISRVANKVSLESSEL